MDVDICFCNSQNCNDFISGVFAGFSVLIFNITFPVWTVEDQSGVGPWSPFQQLLFLGVEK